MISLLSLEQVEGYFSLVLHKTTNCEKRDNSDSVQFQGKGVRGDLLVMRMTMSPDGNELAAIRVAIYIRMYIRSIDPTL